MRSSPVEKLVFRVPGVKALRVPLMLIPKTATPFSSTLLLAYSFIGLIILGAGLLMLPASSVAGTFTSPINALFTATSAVCVTGLVVVDTGTYWSAFGQGIIFALFQIGGLGFIVGATLLLLAIGGKFSLRDRLVISESMGVDQIGGLLGLVFRVTVFTLALEAVGALIFYFRWQAVGESGLTLWTAVFHSASAFYNCGMDLFGGFRSMGIFENDAVTLLATAVLAILGSLGFVVIADSIRHKGFRKVSLDSKIVLVTSLALLVLGTLFFLLAESANPETLGRVGFLQKIVVAFSQSTYIRTAGFATFDLGAMTQTILFVSLFLMCIGGATGSVAGGMKVNTLGVLVITAVNVIRGREVISAFGRQITRQTVYRALTLALFYLGLAGLFVLLLSSTEAFSLEKIIFEVLSAQGTVGATTGITPYLSAIGKFILVITMFTGRLAPLALMAYLVHHSQQVDLEYPHENVRLG